MWIRLRFDIPWRDLMLAAVGCLLPGRQALLEAKTQHTWSDANDCLVTLSVRSAFDLALRALALPKGSEILFSALTVPDMVSIARAHGLVPVPVDIDDEGNLCLASLQAAMSARTRMLVVAHLFGGRMPLDAVSKILQQHDILLVEDCAQRFVAVGEPGHAASDFVMHSFGPIKTATALGGAVVRVACPDLRQRMADHLQGDPLQSRAHFAMRIFRFAGLKFLSGKCIASLFRFGVRCLGRDYDALVNSLGRGFPSSGILQHIRRRPSMPLLRLLRRRWATYDFARIERRRTLGRELDQRCGMQRPPEHAYWVYPLFLPGSQATAEALQAAGFDATCRSRMTVVPAVNGRPGATAAQQRWDQVLFLPWYAELTADAVATMADVLASAIHAAPAVMSSDSRSELLTAPPVGGPMREF